MTISPTVTVIIAAYNCAATIARAVASALAEPEVAEVMVVDDASTDSTIAAAKTADDGSARLKILIQHQNAGPAAARNRAIAQSAAPWITVLDSDDFFLPGRIRGLLAYAEHADMVADDMWQVSEHDIDGARRLLLGESLQSPQTVGFEEFVLSNVTRAGHNRRELGFIKPLMRRSFLDAHTIRYCESMRLGEDFELYARALALGARLLLVPAQGYVSVVRKDSLSGRHSETDLLRLRDCNTDLMALPNLSASAKDALHRHYLSADCRYQWRMLILAVKQRNARAALAAFLRPYPVPLYLCKQLAQQVYLRSMKGRKHA